MKGRCPGCGRDIRLNPSGVLRFHLKQTDAGHCPGSRERPVEIEADKEAT